MCVYVYNRDIERFILFSKRKGSKYCSIYSVWEPPELQHDFYFTDCRLFLCHGADVSQKNKEGDTALALSVSGSKVWTALNTNKRLTDARRERDCQGERQLSR